MAKIDFFSSIFESEMFSLERSVECPIPGYLILRLKGPEESLAELAPQTARALGELLARTAAAIEKTVKAERVYLLSFCEVDLRLHFHLFPRTAWLLKEYRRANGGKGEAVNGPKLFEWARNAFGPGSRVPQGIIDSETAGATMRAILK